MLCGFQTAMEVRKVYNASKRKSFSITLTLKQKSMFHFLIPKLTNLYAVVLLWIVFLRKKYSVKNHLMSFSVFCFRKVVPARHAVDRIYKSFGKMKTTSFHFLFNINSMNSIMPEFPEFPPCQNWLLCIQFEHIKKRNKCLGYKKMLGKYSSHSRLYSWIIGYTHTCK